MRSTLIRVEHAKRGVLAAAIGLGAIALGTRLVRSAAPAVPERQPAGVAAGSSAAAGPAVAPVVSAAAPVQAGGYEKVDVDAMAREALERAKEFEANGNMAGCLAEVATRPGTWVHLSFLNDEMQEAISSKQRDCTRRVRAEAEQAVRAKDYPAAIALLEPLVEFLQEGNFNTVTVDGAWLISDLAFAYLRNHQYVECILVSGGMSIQYAGDSADKVLKALDHNGDRCAKGLDAEYAIRSDGCRISIDGAIATAVAPPGLAPEGARAACVALVPGKRPPDATDDTPDPCPVVAVVWKGARGAIARKELPVEEHEPTDHYLPNPLDEIDFCHGLSSIARGTKDGKSFVRVGGAPDGHCQGKQCLHIGWVDVFYEWNGHALTPALDLTR
jgi:hypothetical protein